MPNVLLLSCDPTDCSSPGPSVHGILQVKVLVCVAISSSPNSISIIISSVTAGANSVPEPL